MASQAAQTLTTQAQTLAHLAFQQTNALTTQAHSLFTSTKQHLNTNAAWSSFSNAAQILGPAAAKLQNSATPAAAATAACAQKAGSAVVQYAKDHPRVIAVQALSVAVAVVPGLVAVPALGVVGLGAGGPVAGELLSMLRRLLWRERLIA